MFFRFTKKVILLCLIILHIGCISANKIRDSIEAEVIKCLDFVEIKLGEFILSNNTWNRGSVINYDQCVFQIQKDSIFPFGWKWDWPLDVDKVRA